jgi:hypothetical protein
MGIEDLRQKLAPEALITVSRAARVSRSHGGILVPQDIAAILASGPFQKAFGDRNTWRGAVAGFRDWGSYEAELSRRRGDGINATELLGDSRIRITTSARGLLYQAHYRAQSDEREHAGNLDLLVTILGDQGGDPVEPLSFMTGDTSSSIMYRQLVLARARGVAIRGYLASEEYQLAQKTIATNIQKRLKQDPTAA